MLRILRNVNKTRLLLGLLALALGSVVIQTLLASRAIEQQYAQIAEQAMPMQLAALDFQLNVIQIQHRLRNLDTPAAGSNALYRVEKHYRQARQLIAELNGLDQARSGLYSDLRSALEAFYRQTTALAANPSDMSLGLQFEAAGDALMAQVDELLAASQSSKQALMPQQAATAQQVEGHLLGLAVLLVVTLAGLLLMQPSARRGAPQREQSVQDVQGDEIGVLVDRIQDLVLGAYEVARSAVQSTTAVVSQRTDVGQARYALEPCAASAAGLTAPAETPATGGLRPRSGVQFWI